MAIRRHREAITITPPDPDHPHSPSIRAIPAATVGSESAIQANAAELTSRNLFLLRPSNNAETDSAPSAHAQRRDRRHLANTLISDASVRTTNAGRILLRALLPHVGPDLDWETLADELPPHCLEAAAELANSCAEDWRLLAERIARRTEGYRAGEDFG